MSVNMRQCEYCGNSFTGPFCGVCGQPPVLPECVTHDHSIYNLYATARYDFADTFGSYRLVEFPNEMCELMRCQSVKPPEPDSIIDMSEPRPTRKQLMRAIYAVWAKQLMIRRERAVEPLGHAGFERREAILELAVWLTLSPEDIETCLVEGV